MRRVLSISVFALVLLFFPMSGWADTAGPFCDTVSFEDDLDPPQNIDLPSFDVDGAGGPYNLLGVTVEVSHSGSADMKIDNDSAVTTDCRARIIRNFAFNGPGIGLQSGANTEFTGFETLGNENGDAGTADFTAPDGHDFGNVNYSGEPAGTFNPATSLYDTNGPSTVSFPIGDDGFGGGLSFSNDFQFTPTTPANRQIDLGNTLLTAQVCVTYTFEAAPPPPMGIPTVSQWGLIVLTLLTLTAATLVFGRRGGMVSA